MTNSSVAGPYVQNFTIIKYRGKALFDIWQHFMVEDEVNPDKYNAYSSMGSDHYRIESLVFHYEI